MVSQISIDKVKDAANIADIVPLFVSMKDKRGKTMEGCCPFHNEKTPSFTITPAKGIYKCFGCGASGDTIKFLMELQKITFIEAIEYLATHYRIEIEYDGTYNKEEVAAYKEKENVKKRILEYALGVYHRNLFNVQSKDSAVWSYLRKRNITPEVVETWKLGFAPDEFKNISGTLIENGWVQQATELGLCNTKNNNTYDTYRNRIIFPIYDKNGSLVGFAGRALGEDKPKYINPPENASYNKGTMLYNLHRASTEIRQQGWLYLTEGYLDVIKMDTHDIGNVVCTCGTALTADQIKLIKRYCNHVVLLRDGDNAGMLAAEKDINALLHYDIKVEIAILPEGHDPDSYIDSLVG